LADDFSIYLFSDGILEIIKGDKLEEKEQNLLRLCQADQPSPETLLKRVVDEEAELPDDVAIMMVSRRC
jgi:sigma-B regulation protein RsbU (phosphoserine phosphatase)